MYGHTLGIVGLAKGGALVVERPRVFGMTIIYSDRTRLPAARQLALGVSYRPLDVLLAESNFVSLHASNIGPNDRLIGHAAFASMKRTSFFINTSRGRLVDEDALMPGPPARSRLPASTCIASSRGRHAIASRRRIRNYGTNGGDYCGNILPQTERGAYY